ncbi:hypothetical protein ACSYAY_06080 [Leptospirillum ferriphilum]
MSVMCSKDSCKARTGMCGHKKGMMVMMLVVLAGAAGHWMFHWF